ncbi:MAG TPA: protoglobin domain-containing protein [Acidobacteriota bacterium]|nr:protoglobin domain-containing protein [Acidobacteriota bacterium]
MIDRLKFLRFEAKDQQYLKELLELFSEHADEIVEGFYNHLLKFEETRALLTSEQVSKRLKSLQKEYLLSLVRGTYDEEYVESRLRIGRTHERIRLEPKYYLGTYSLYVSLLYPLIFKKYQDDPEKLLGTLLALTRIISLDSQLAMEAYIETYHQKLAFINTELEKMNWTLEERVEERTKELKEFEERFRHAERLVIVGTLASEIAHEVGTPLNIISGRLELVADRGKDDERIQKDVKIIHQQLDRITKIIRDLLEMSRKKESHVKQVDLQHLIRSLAEFLKIPLERSKVEISIDIPEKTAHVVADEDQLQQVFINLLMNAIHAIEENGKITIRGSSRKIDGRLFTEIQVKDTGPGIAPEIIEKIFDPFFSTKKDTGTGLGLSIAKDIVKRHGGEIWVESNPSEGTTFFVRIPA